MCCNVNNVTIRLSRIRQSICVFVRRTTCVCVCLSTTGAHCEKRSRPHAASSRIARWRKFSTSSKAVARRQRGTIRKLVTCRLFFFPCSSKREMKPIILAMTTLPLSVHAQTDDTDPYYVSTWVLMSFLIFVYIALAISVWPYSRPRVPLFFFLLLIFFPPGFFFLLFYLFFIALFASSLVAVPEAQIDTNQYRGKSRADIAMEGMRV